MRWVNSQKCWTMTQYREFEDPAIATGENWMMKIAAKKTENVSLIFSIAILVTQRPTHSPPSITIIAEPSMGDENRAEKIKNIGMTFSATIFINQQPTHSPAPSQSLPDPRWVMKIALEKVETPFLLFSSQLWPPPPLQSSQDPRWVMKIVLEKSKTSV